MYESIATKREILAMSRPELKNYLEGCRGMAVYDDEGTKLLRECAMEDAGYKLIDNGRIKQWRKI